jgi:hypothetical protein
MSRRRKRKRPNGLVGLAILGLAGAGVWIGAGLVDDAGDLIPRALDRSAGDTVGPPPVPSPWDRVRVEVLNAGGVRGMAASARDELRDAGFDVVHYGNASTFEQVESEVILRGGTAEAAENVARALGIEQVRVEQDASLLVEVTVLLGSGWRTRAEREGASGDAAEAGRNPEGGTS